MTPQTAAFLEKAENLLVQAQSMLSIGLNEAAGRTAYLAGFHAAQGLIFESTRERPRRTKAFKLNFND